MRLLILLALTFILDLACADEKLDQIILSANKGDPESQYQLGLYYAMSESDHGDLVKAAYWLTESALQGIPGALIHLERIGKLPENHEKNLPPPRPVANAGGTYLYAMRNLAHVYNAGYGTDVNKIEAYRWYKQAQFYSMKPGLYQTDGSWEQKHIDKIRSQMNKQVRIQAQFLWDDIKRYHSK